MCLCKLLASIECRTFFWKRLLVPGEWNQQSVFHFFLEHKYHILNADIEEEWWWGGAHPCPKWYDVSVMKCTLEREGADVEQLQSASIAYQ